MNAIMPSLRDGECQPPLHLRSLSRVRLAFEEEMDDFKTGVSGREANGPVIARRSPISINLG